MVADEIPDPVGGRIQTRLTIRQNSRHALARRPQAVWRNSVPILDAAILRHGGVDPAGEPAAPVGGTRATWPQSFSDRFRIKRQIRVSDSHMAASPDGSWPDFRQRWRLSYVWISPGHMSTLINDPLGTKMILVAGALQVLGTLTIRKLVNVPYEERRHAIRLSSSRSRLRSCWSRWFQAGRHRPCYRPSLPERRRLRQLGMAGGYESIADAIVLVDDVSPRIRRFPGVPRSPKKLTQLRRRLAMAGYQQPAAVVVFAAASFIIPMVLVSLVIAFVGLRSGFILAIFVGAIGYLLPGIALARQGELRKADIRNGLPDALDLLIVCVEAGCGLDQAIVKASDELDIAYPVLAQEFRLVTTEIRAGKPRLEAFKNFATRTKVDDVRSLVALLVQTDRFGTSIAPGAANARGDVPHETSSAGGRASRQGGRQARVPAGAVSLPGSLRRHSGPGGDSVPFAYSCLPFNNTD